MSDSRRVVIFLMGPTASGKTDLAINLRQHLPVELISVDSALIYKGMDIGTAKPTAAEQRQAPHRLIDICDPSESYSAADFRSDALREIDDIHRAGRIPLLVGGTMLYFKALLEGLADMPQADAAIRVQIEQDAEQFGWPYVHKQLAAVDPQTAAQLHPNHSQRISRALEVFRVSGKTMTELKSEQDWQGQDLKRCFRVVQFVIAPQNRALLHRRIEQRFHSMMAMGFLDEVRVLYERRDLHRNLPAMRAVGYRQAWQYLDGEYGLETMVERGVIATRQLAKRQLTWLRGWDDIKWLYSDDSSGHYRKKDELIIEFLNYFHETSL